MPRNIYRTSILGLKAVCKFILQVSKVWTVIFIQTLPSFRNDNEGKMHALSRKAVTSGVWRLGDYRSREDSIWGGSASPYFSTTTDWASRESAKPFTNNLCRVNYILRWTTSIIAFLLDFTRRVLFNAMIWKILKQHQI